MEALARLYRSSVTAVGPASYTEEQVASWAAFPDEREAFRAFVLGPTTLVAHAHGTIVGFGGVTVAGRVASLYVHPEHGRQGVATALLQALMDRARAQGIRRLRTEASVFSRPVFERMGFSLDEVEVVERRGAIFQRYRMSLTLEMARDPSSVTPG